MSRSLKKIDFSTLLSYNMKTSLICCMNGNRTIEVLVSQCKTVFSPLFTFLSSTSPGKIAQIVVIPCCYNSAGLSTWVSEFLKEQCDDLIVQTNASGLQIHFVWFEDNA